MRNKASLVHKCPFNKAHHLCVLSCVALTSLMITDPVEAASSIQAEMTSAYKEKQTTENKALLRPKDITVTAKRPISKQASSSTHISAEDMQAYRMQTVSDIAERVPNLSFTSMTPSNPVVTVRGMGSSEDHGSSSYTPILIDGVSVPSFALGQIFDLSDVDVMRGAQLTEGINAFAGLISAHSHDPGDKLSASASFEYGTGNRKRGSFTADIPVNDSTSIRLALGGETADGYIHNKALDKHNTGGWHSWWGRLKILHTDSSGGEWRISLHHMINHGGNDYFEMPENAKKHISYSTDQGKNDTEYLLGSLQYHRSFSEHLNIDAMFGGVGTKWKYWNPRSVFNAVSGNSAPTQQIGGSLMLSGTFGKLDWKGGVYGQRALRSSPYDFDMSPYYISHTTADLRTTEIAFMGELGWHFAQNWKLVPSIRVEHVDSSLKNWTSSISGDVPTAFSMYQSLPDQTISKTVPLPGVKLEYSPKNFSSLRQFMWLSYTRSFLAPGYNPFSNYAETASVPYSSSYGNNIELGYRVGDKKNIWSIEVVGFSNFLSNLQVAATSKLGETVVATAKKAHSRGMEATVHWRPIHNFQLNGFVGLTYAAYDRFIYGGKDYSGELMDSTPISNFGFSGAWTPIKDLTVNASIIRRGRSTLHPSSNVENDPYLLMDAQIEKRWKHWSIAIYGHNLTDSGYYTRGVPSGRVVAANPRQIGLRAGVSF